MGLATAKGALCPRLAEGGGGLATKSTAVAVTVAMAVDAAMAVFMALVDGCGRGRCPRRLHASCLCPSAMQWP